MEDMAVDESLTLEDASLTTQSCCMLFSVSGHSCARVYVCMNVFSTMNEIKEYKLSAMCRSLTLGLYLLADTKVR